VQPFLFSAWTWVCEGAPVSKHIARKRFGQHFLSDGLMIGQIVDAIAPQADQTMIEIGPGLGALTLPLLERISRLTVVELDRDLVARLQLDPRLNVVGADVLSVDFTALAASLRVPCVRVVGNLPYNISTPILFHLLDHVAVVQDQHFMLQKEVVQRMVAAPRTAAYGRLSVMLQWRYDMEDILDVPPECFDPPPRVDSAIVRMVPKAAPEAVDVALLSELVKVAFSQRRKVLRHTLEPWLAAHGFSGAFDARRRAEEVSVAEYIGLSQAISPGLVSAI
jgi:16S rRNA (adenine1518-N6/adenine1519-N6)-dimethyltransferase